jgi:hypothetical protein
MSKPGTIGRGGSRIRNLRDLQTTFKNSIGGSKTTPANGASQDRSNSSSTSTTVESVHDPTMLELTLLRAKEVTTLLQLILKQELLDLDSFWQPVGDSNAIISVILDLAKDLQKQKEDELSEILGTTRAPLSPQSKQNPSKYPTMKQYDVSLEDRRVHQSLLSELYHVNKKHGNTTTLYCSVSNSKLSSFVFFPSSNDFGTLRVNENNSK